MSDVEEGEICETKSQKRQHDEADTDNNSKFIKVVSRIPVVNIDTSNGFNPPSQDNQTNKASNDEDLSPIRDDDEWGKITSDWTSKKDVEKENSSSNKSANDWGNNSNTTQSNNSWGSTTNTTGYNDSWGSNKKSESDKWKTTSKDSNTSASTTSNSWGSDNNNSKSNDDSWGSWGGGNNRSKNTNTYNNNSWGGRRGRGGRNNYNNASWTSNSNDNNGSNSTWTTITSSDNINNNNGSGSGTSWRDGNSSWGSSGNTNNRFASNRECYICHQEGHLSRDCPNRGINNTMRGGRGGYRGRGGFRSGRGGGSNNNNNNNNNINSGNVWGNDNNNNNNGYSNDRDNRNNECYKCHKHGHLPQDCPNKNESNDNKWDKSNAWSDVRISNTSLSNNNNSYLSPTSLSSPPPAPPPVEIKPKGPPKMTKDPWQINYGVPPPPPPEPVEEDPYGGFTFFCRKTEDEDEDDVFNKTTIPIIEDEKRFEEERKKYWNTPIVNDPDNFRLLPIKKTQSTLPTHPFWHGKISKNKQYLCDVSSYSLVIKIDTLLLNFPSSLDFSLKVANTDIHIDWAKPYTTFYLKYAVGPKKAFDNVLAEMREKKISFVSTCNINNKDVRIFIFSPEAGSTMLRLHHNIDKDTVVGYLRYRS